MPAPLKADHEAVKTLAIAVGVREAARRTGLSEDRVRQWSCRGKWFVQPTPTPLPPTVTQHAVTTVTNPGQAMLNSLADASKETRFNLAKAAQKAAKSFSKRSGEAVIKSSKALRDVVAASSQLHGWEDKGSQGVTLNLGIAFNNMQ